ncbi:N-acetylmuramoyl-L-alanine amidase [Candidatus Parcubacteria bacterium]|nr:N-acetylmuramoyl-L-alanine amidase [Candidatus Parcubacteria bacterium]
MPLPISKFATKRVFVVTASVILVVLAGFIYKQGTATAIKNNQVTGLGANGEPSVVALEPGETSTTYDSPVRQTDFQFNAIAPQWRQSDAAAEASRVFLRTSVDAKTWTDWMEVEGSRPLRDDAPSPDTMFAETPLMIQGRFFQYRVALSRQDPAQPAPEVSDLKVTYIDSRQNLAQKLMGALTSFLAPDTRAAAQGPAVVSRAGWGSPDPDGTAYQGTSLYWGPEYVQTKQVFVHHTVSANNQPDPAATVRAIWQYHTHTLGWGDIGYNFLTDQHGTIYQGRFGGDHVVAGHVYGYNRGSLGIAAIGCFDPNDSACKQLNNGNVTGPSSALLNGLTNFLGWKTSGYQINPNTTHTFCGTACLNLWTVAGHKDALSTACPGNLLYDQLGFIRNQTSQRKLHYDYSWALSSQAAYTTSAKTAAVDLTNLSPGQTAWLVLKARNSGNLTWSNSGANPVSLGTEVPRDRASRFATGAWLGANRPARLVEASVAPGEVGTFEFPIAVPKGGGVFNEHFNLVTEGVTWMSDVGLYYHTTVKSGYSWGVTSQYAYTDSAKTAPANLHDLSPGQTVFVGLTARNNGTATWYNGGPYPVNLATTRPTDRTSRFQSTGWLGAQRPARMKEASVAPGETATFEFNYTAPASGAYQEYFNPVAEGIMHMNDAGVYYDTRVKYDFTYALASQEAYTTSAKTTAVDLTNLSPGQTAWLVFKARNSGNVSWSNGGSNPVRLGTEAPRDRGSRYATGAWLGPNRPAGLVEASVAPGEVGTFEFPIAVPKGGGTFNERFNLVAEGITWMNDIGLYYHTVVKSDYSWSVTSQYAYTDSTKITPADLTKLSPGQTVYVGFTARNSGTATWYNTGPYPVNAATARPTDRSSGFQSTGWLAPQRPARMKEASVAPGGIATFEFNYTAPAAGGTYQEYFRPVAEGIAHLNDAGMYFNSVVQ